MTQQTNWLPGIIALAISNAPPFSTYWAMLS